MNHFNYFHSQGLHISASTVSELEKMTLTVKQPSKKHPSANIHRSADRVGCREIDLFPFGQSPIVQGNDLMRQS
jgi:hypothetical protein